jgi:superfamily II DNA or RNA helicase
MPDQLQPGLYDELVDMLLRARIDALDAARVHTLSEPVDAAELPERIADLVRRWTEHALAVTKDADRGHTAERIAASVLAALEAVEPAVRDVASPVPLPVSRLLAVERRGPTKKPIRIDRPLTPLRDTVLITNARGQPSVGHEIAAEIASADRIEVLLAFIRWTGIRDLLENLRAHTQAGKPLRVITTVYTGSTEQRALQALVDIGAQVKVSFDTSTTRLHAKAWLFQRSTGHSTVYIGSSNLTFSAQVTGLEWNVRASAHANAELVDAVERTFATYWADDHFEDFEAERFASAMQSQRANDSILTPFAIEPYPFQRHILERLALARAQGQPHNLVVAATGTGKTIIAALDYRALRRTLPRARLLFVAHRETILRQSQTVFRHVLGDGAFGERWVDGQQPTQWEHVFASIMSIRANDITHLDPAHFDVVIVDEFHHAAADSYVQLLDYLRPRHLLGLTATPERTDQLDILRWFGGETTVELRLWDALEQGLLCPFHYYGIHDGTDLKGVTWRRGKGYDASEVTNLYTADDVWVGKVLKAMRDKVGDASRMRALGFCASVAHAEFMASRFARAGLPAVALKAESSVQAREEALGALARGEIRIIFTVDLFSEGIDVPAVDVVLMLRPTESAIVFQQQLGRGLRRSDGKDVLTVLDFVGHHRKEFRFEARFRSLLGNTRRQLQDDVESDFPFLPAGCRISLDRVAREIVLDNLRNALPTQWRRRVAELRSLGDVSLAAFLDETGLSIEDIYRSNESWTALRRAAGVPVMPSAPGEEEIERGIGRLLHIDDPDRLMAYQDFLSAASPDGLALDARRERQLHGLLLTLLPQSKGAYPNLADATHLLWQHPAMRAELLELLQYLSKPPIHLQAPLGVLAPVPLCTHASYTREEVLAAFGASTVMKRLPLQSGVYWHEQSKTDLLFITLQKTEKHYSPTTRYKDYAISDRLFHWESQSTTSLASPTGQRYLHHAASGSKVVLFIREQRKNDAGRAMPYFCAGTATYVEHRSERPIQITWRLDRPLPGDVFASYRAAIA